MKRGLLGISLVLCAAPVFAEMTDNFDSYATGELTTVAPTWHKYENNSSVPDYTVVADGRSAPNAMRTDGKDVGGLAPEVVRTFPKLFSTPTKAAHIGFDFLVHETGAQTIDSYINVGDADPNNYSVGYGTFAFVINWVNASSPGAASLHVWDLQGADGDFGLVELARPVTIDVWHRVDVYLKLNVADPSTNPTSEPDGTFLVYLDHMLVTPNPLTFSINSPLGLNSIDSWSGHNNNHDGDWTDYIQYDNIVFEEDHSAAFFQRPDTRDVGMYGLRDGIVNWTNILRRPDVGTTFEGFMATNEAVFRTPREKLGKWTVDPDGTVTAWAEFASILPTWKIAGFYDMDEDMDKDIVAYNDSMPGATLVGYWTMQDGAMQSWHRIGYVNGDWDVLGTVDLDGDGDADLLMHNPANNKLGAYGMQDGLIVGWHNMGAMTWEYAGASDVNWDGRKDLLLYNPADGMMGYWTIGNFAITGYKKIGATNVMFMPAGAR